MIVRVDYLVKNGACNGGLTAFLDTFPTGSAKVTVPNVKKLMDAMKKKGIGMGDFNHWWKSATRELYRKPEVKAAIKKLITADAAKVTALRATQQAERLDLENQRYLNQKWYSASLISNTIYDREKNRISSRYHALNSALVAFGDKLSEKMQENLLYEIAAAADKANKSEVVIKG